MTNPHPASGPLAALRRGFDVAPRMVLLIAALGTVIALLLWINEERPFWHPFVSVQCFGFAIAYCVNVARPWDSPRPVLRLVQAVLAGALLGMLLTIVLKGYTMHDLRERSRLFVATVLNGFVAGLFVSAIFLIKFRQARADAALLKAEAERHLLAKQAAEAELKLMQAQVEPHFLFNTLASLQYLIETNPHEANRLLGHLLEYLRAAVPQLRSSTSTLGQQIDLAQAYLNVLKIRMGERLHFAIAVPEPLRSVPFPPVLLMSLVENAIEHGLEPTAQGGSVVIEALQHGDGVRVSVADTGRGLDPSRVAGDGRGVGLTNLRERLVALYGDRARFTLENVVPRGARATIEIPRDDA